MTKATRGRYTLEFKQEAVRLVESGQTMAAAARIVRDTVPLQWRSVMMREALESTQNQTSRYRPMWQVWPQRSLKPEC